MKIVIMVVAILVGFLSLAAGTAKITLQPDEVDFLGQFGLGNALIISYGILQALAGLLMLIPATRFYGAVIAALCFAASLILIFMSGNMAFAIVSLVPCLLAVFIAYRSRSNSVSTESE